jgi:hypothetical protein
VKETDRQQDLDWLQNFKGLYEEAIQLVLEFSRKTPVRDKETRLVWLKELQNKFANIEKSLSRVPKPKSSDLREINHGFQFACSNYSAACKMSMELAKRPTVFMEEATVLTLEKAEKAMDKVHEQLELLSKS